jgi:Zn-finger nucleic acid-binding protein
MRCPECRVGLHSTKTPAGIIFHCPQCDGQAVALGILRRTGKKEVVQQLWNLAKDARANAAKCPACDSRMAEVALPMDASSPLVLEICTACQFVWLAPGEHEKIPVADPAQPEKPMSAAAREAIALRGVQMEADRAEREERAEKAGRVHLLHPLLRLLQIPFK